MHKQLAVTPGTRNARSVIAVVVLSLFLVTSIAAYSVAAPDESQEAEPQADPGMQSPPKLSYFGGYLRDNAKKAMARKRYDQAEGFLKKALENNPGNPELLELLAEAQERQGRWQEASDTLGHLVEQEDADPDTLFRRGMARWNAGQGEQAREDLMQALLSEKLAEESKSEAEKAVADIDAGFRTAAGASMKAETDPSRVDEDWPLVALMEEKKDWAGLDAFYTRLLDTKLENPGFAYAARGFARIGLGKIEHAESDFSLALKDPGLPEDVRKTMLVTLKDLEQMRRKDAAWDILQAEVTRLEKNQDWEQLKKLYTGILEKEPANGHALSSLGFIQLNQGRQEEARRNLQAALSGGKLSPDLAQAVETTLAHMDAGTEQLSEWNRVQARVKELTQKKDWAALDAYYTELAEREEYASYALINRAFLRMQRGKLDAAEQDFMTAKSKGLGDEARAGIESGLNQIRELRKPRAVPRQRYVAPRYYAGKAAPVSYGPNVWDYFAQIREQLRRKEYAAAASRLEELERMPLATEEKGMTAYLYGELLWARENRDAAYAKFEEAASLLKEQYHLSETYWRMSEYNRRKENRDLALRYALRSTELLPEESWRASQVGNLFTHFRMYREAVEHYKRAIQLSPDEEPYSFLELSRAYAMLGDEDAQIRNLRHYIDRMTDRVAAQPGKVQQDIEDLYDARRQHANLIRTFGFESYLFYSRHAHDNYATFMANEFYREFHFLNTGIWGRIYAQFNGNLASHYSGEYYEPWTDSQASWEDYSHLGDSAHAIVGVRVYPFQRLSGLSVALEQVIKVGSLMDHDTRFRLGYFYALGLDLEPYVPSWNYVFFLNEGIYSTRSNNIIGYGELRGGRSFRMDCFDDRFVITPYLGMTWGYGGKYISSSERWSLEAGPGISFRKWYREDRYNAPRSSIDVSLQYRWGISHNRDDSLWIMFSQSF